MDNDPLGKVENGRPKDQTKSNRPAGDRRCGGGLPTRRRGRSTDGSTMANDRRKDQNKSDRRRALRLAVERPTDSQWQKRQNTGPKYPKNARNTIYHTYHHTVVYKLLGRESYLSPAVRVRVPFVY